jgi:hypothetical protein
VAYHPTIAGEPIIPVSGFVLADVMLVVLSVCDWVSHRRRQVFPFALLVLVAYHGWVLTFHRFPFWHAFSSWLAGR